MTKYLKILKVISVLKYLIHIYNKMYNFLETQFMYFNIEYLEASSYMVLVASSLYYKVY